MINRRIFYPLFLVTVLASLTSQSSVKAQEFSTIEIPCGKAHKISSLQILTKCPVDIDKDDVPDQANSVIKFTNLSDQDIYFTTQYANGYHNGYHNSGSFIGDYIQTTFLKSKSSFELPISNILFNKNTQRYTYPKIVLGRLNIPASDTSSDELSCQDIQGTAQKKFGVTYKLTCDSYGVSLKVDKPYDLNRTLVVKYRTISGVDQETLIDSNSFRNGNNFSLPKSNKYGIKILIPDPNKKVTLIQPTKPIAKTNTQNKVATVFAPPSNVRETPMSNGKVICAVDTVKKIKTYGSEKEWYKTDICGKIGYIHSSQIRFP